MSKVSLVSRMYKGLRQKTYRTKEGEKDLKLVYFSYPYTSNPKGNTREVQKLVRRVLKKNSDFVPMVPHFVFDALHGYPKEGYGKAFSSIGLMELELISRCDLFVYSPNHMSAGVYWELCFAKRKKIPVKTYEELV